MPGARLTHEDRRQIAAWLAGGLGYAEIARRLGRPTSTISREVARNGQPGDYLPDPAQQASAQRAHRRRDQARKPADEQPAELVRAFVDQFAALLAETGLPRMPSRVFVCLLTCDSGSLTATDLVRRLQVSPASVSKSISYLERMDLVARKPDAVGRRERYAIVDDVWLRAWRTDAGAHAKVANAAQRGTEIFGADTPTGTRLSEMGRFFSWLSGQMSDSGVAETTVHDALTVLAALAYATRPLSVGELVSALDWPRKRITDALDALVDRPGIADPLALVPNGRDTFTITTRPDRLSPAQREALRAGTASTTVPLPPPAEDCWLHPDVEVRHSPIEGHGLFAGAAIPAGTVVSRLGGRLVSGDELRRLIADPDRSYVDTIAVGADTHLVLPPRRDNGYGNHGCDPNLWWVGPYELAARRDLVPGEELTNDYATSTADPAFTMRCGCRASLCRGTVTGNDWHLPDLQTRYGDHWVPALLTRINIRTHRTSEP